MQWILYGLLMILIVFVLPEGIVPAVERWFDRFSSKERPRDVALDTGKGGTR